MLIERPHRREILQPQLTALIDVCSLLIIFLIAGTTFGASVIVLPSGLKLPLSSAQTELAAAPQVAIAGASVTASFAPGRVFSIESFRAEHRADAEAFRSIARALVKERGGPFLNILADRNVPYRDLYDVIEALRQEGFEALNFVSEPTRRPGAG